MLSGPLCDRRREAVFAVVVCGGVAMEEAREPGSHVRGVVDFNFSVT